MTSTSNSRIDEKPTIARFFVPLALTIAVGPAVVLADDGSWDRASTRLTESDAVERAVGRGALTDALAGAVDAERGAALTAGAYPNPQVSYLREQTFGALGTGEDYLSLSQVIDLGNRRGLRRKAGERRAKAVELEGDAVRIEIAAQARHRFFEVLRREQRIATLSAWLVRIDEALDVVSRRAARGDAATYDRRRLERESIVARSRLASELAALEHARARLAAIVGIPVERASGIDAVGELLPPPPSDAPTALRDDAARRPDLLAWDRRSEAASIDRRSAKRRWLPDLRLDGGWKGVAYPGQGRSDGFLAGAVLTLPIWDRSLGLRRSADAETRIARGRRELLAAELAGETTGLHRASLQLHRAAREFRSASVVASTDLVRIATAGYEGGEMTVLELLDAYRGAAEDALAAVDLDHAARQMRIEITRATGGIR